MDDTHQGLVQWIQDLFNNLFIDNSYHTDRAKVPSEFAKEIDSLFPPHINILEIGCGYGHDAHFFAKKEHRVTALDSSKVIIQEAKRVYGGNEAITFRVFNIINPLPIQSDLFDVIFAHFSLQYFTDSQTKIIFAELTRVLKPFGLFCFSCRSTLDSEYKIGKKIEEGVFMRNKRLRHFFTSEYALQCLQNNYKIIMNRETVESIWGKAIFPVNAIQVVAKKQ